MSDSTMAFDWLYDPVVQQVLDVLEQGGDQARVVGGAVRNTVMGLAVEDIDIATTALPETVLARAEVAGLKAVGTGIDHGTVTIVAQGRPFEVTTLREDVETFGRKASVRFGRDWTRDAERRDFKLNALYVDRSGVLFDPLGGLEDCRAGRIVFIGDPESRIREDYLRILRFYRFWSHYGSKEPDAAGRKACAGLKDGLSSLSAERLSKELLKLLSGSRAASCLEMMAEDGVLDILFGQAVYVPRFRHLQGLLSVIGDSADSDLGLGVLSLEKREEIAGLAIRFRLSGAIRSRLEAAVSARDMLVPMTSPGTEGEDIQRLRLGLYRFGRQACRDGLYWVFASTEGRTSDPAVDTERLSALLTLLKRLDLPKFPLSGGDLIAHGLVQAGPEVGRCLANAETIWISSGFFLSPAELVERLKSEKL